MRIAYLADARSPIAISWISYFVERGHEVHVISSYPCSPGILSGARVYPFPFAFSSFSRVRHDGTIGAAKRRSLAAASLASARIGALSSFSHAARFWLSPFQLEVYLRRARQLITRIGPDIVHSMRIPFEGILAAKATPAGIPLLVSVWGNDFTLFAERNPLIARQTRQAMRRADALHCDCRRDMRLAAEEWGFDPRKPSMVLPGAGGVQRRRFRAYGEETGLAQQLEIAPDTPVIFNPRGFRSYVRNDIFFKAIPLVLEQHPEPVFVCTGMEGNPVAQRWVKQIGRADRLRLLPIVSREQMAALFRLAQISVSPSLHDGTPNTLLEAMACGSFPIAGDIESVREWITDGVNGLLCDVTRPEPLARAITRALRNSSLRSDAEEYNLRLIEKRADYDSVMSQAEDLYLRVVQRRGAPASV